MLTLTGIELGLLGVGGLLLLVLLRVPVGVALVLVGVLGNLAFLGVDATLAQLQLTIWESGSQVILVVLPLFILMGQLASEMDLGADLFRGFQIWLGRTRGGLAMSSVMSSASFGVITGSSAASLMATTQILLPQMRQRGYDEALAAGSVASGSVLAILIPPSLPLVFYSAWTETSLGDLFAAALVPGCLLTLLFVLVILGQVWRTPSLAPRSEPTSWSEKLHALRYLVPTSAILFGVLASIYLGIATPSEAAAIGVLGVVLAGVARGTFSWQALSTALSRSATLNANIFLLLLGGLLLGRFLVQTGLTPLLVKVVTAQSSTPEMGILSLVLLYLLLGAILDTFSMIILTLPFVFPLVVGLGYDPVWFGVFLVVMCELGLITPPIGLSAFLLNRLQPDVSLVSIYRGCIPFVLATLVLAALLIFIPQIALWLPGYLKTG